MKIPSGLDKTAATTLVSLSAPPLSSSVIFMTVSSGVWFWPLAFITAQRTVIGSSILWPTEKPLHWSLGRWIFEISHLKSQVRMYSHHMGTELCDYCAEYHVINQMEHNVWCRVMQFAVLHWCHIAGACDLMLQHDAALWKTKSWARLRFTEKFATNH